MADEFLDDDGSLSSDFIFVEEVPDGTHMLPQALWTGVRPGYGPDGERLPEPTVWVQYQERYMNSSLTGPVAMSTESWDKLNEAVQWRVAEWKERASEKLADQPADNPGDSLLRHAGLAGQSAFEQPALPFPGSDGNTDGQVNEDSEMPVVR